MRGLYRSPLIGKELFAIRNDKIVVAKITKLITVRGAVTGYWVRTDEVAKNEVSDFAVSKKYTGTDREELLKKLFKLKLKGLI